MFLKKALILVLMFSLLIVGQVSAAGNLFVAQSIPTLNNPWYVQFAEGSERMADTLGIEFKRVTNSETSPWSPSQQINRIENLIAQRPDVIEIDPTTTDGINSAVNEARSRGIKVVTSGINISTEVDASVVADNLQGGNLAGEYLAEVLNGSGKVALLQGTPGRDIIQDRQNGFRNALKKYENIEIVTEQIADLERAKGMEVAENILQAYPDLDAIWAANDEMALGAVEAAKARNLVGKLIIGGFDATPDALEAIQNGQMRFSVNQIPFEMGARAIAISYMVGNDIKLTEKNMVLPVNLVSVENIEEFTANIEVRQNKIIDEVKMDYGL